MFITGCSGDLQTVWVRSWFLCNKKRKTIHFTKRWITCYQVFQDASILQWVKNLARKRNREICAMTMYEQIKFHLIYKHIKDLHNKLIRTLTSLKVKTFFSKTGSSDLEISAILETGQRVRRLYTTVIFMPGIVEVNGGHTKYILFRNL